MTNQTSTQFEKTSLTQLEAVTLAKEGKEAWNNWAKENPDAEVNFSEIIFSTQNLFDFSGFVFPGYVNFYGVTLEDANFDRATFLGDVTFENSKFQGAATRFIKTSFKNSVDFSSCRFQSDHTSFVYANFFGNITNFQKLRAEGNYITFSKTDFRNGTIIFDHALFSGQFFKFDNAEFQLLDVSFSDMKVSNAQADFSKTEFVNSDINFSCVQFSGKGANFTDVKFLNSGVTFHHSIFGGGEIDFNKVRFEKSVDFSGTKFLSSVFFKNARFIDTSDFSFIELDSACQLDMQNSHFKGLSNFSGAKLDGPVNLEGSRFKIIPDFRRTILTAHFTLHNMEVTYQVSDEKIWTFFSKTADNTDTDKYRRLKEIAITAKDHDKELDFFALELKAKRGHIVTKLPLVLSFLYEILSDFGRSVSRPALGLASTWLAFGTIYWLAALFFPLDPEQKLTSGLKLSAAILMPFSAASKLVFTKNGTLAELFSDNPSLFFYFAASLETFLGIAFLFLIGLALRNRFRI